MELSEKMRKEIERLIELNEIVKLDDERIGSCIADRFPEMYSNEQEYIEFNEEIANCVHRNLMSKVHEEVGIKAAQEGMAKKIEIHTTVGEWYRYVITVEEGSALVQSSNLDQDEEFDKIEEMADFFDDNVGFPMESYTGHEIENREAFIEYFKN